MKEYYLDYCEKSDNYHVKARDYDFAITFNDKAKANALMLSFMLQTAKDPVDNPSEYELLPTNDGYKLFKTKDVTIEDDGWADEGCCQSGCPGCPWTEKHFGKSQDLQG